MSLAQSHTGKQCKKVCDSKIRASFAACPMQREYTRSPQNQNQLFPERPNSTPGPCWPQAPPFLALPPSDSLADGEGGGEMAEAVETRFGRRAHGPRAGMQGVTCALAAVSVLSSVPDGACSGPSRSPAGRERAQLSWTLLIPPTDSEWSPCCQPGCGTKDHLMVHKGLYLLSDSRECTQTSH